MPARSGTIQLRRRAVAADAVVALIAVIAGLLVAAGPAAPTGHPATDGVLCGVAAAVVVFVGARAPWWTAVVAAGVALATALDPRLMAFAALALAAGLWLGSTRRAWPEALAASLAVSFNVLARSELGGQLGTSAAITLVVGALVFVLGIRRRSRRVQLLAAAGVILVVLAAGAASAGFGYAAMKARHNLGAGQSTAELGVVALENGDFDAAADGFREAADNLAAADRYLDKPWAKWASAVPILAQHQRAVSNMSHVGLAGARTVTEALEEIDLESLRPVGGRFDLDALAALEGPLTRVQQALLQLQQTTDASYSQWLAHRATAALLDFSESIDEHLPSLDNSLDAIRMAPALLGADGPRTYLLLFTTPSEARGLGGFVGSYAELTFDDGQISFGTFGRAQDLDGAALTAGARVHDHDEFRHEYGRFGFDTDGNGAVGDAAFRNLAMTPNFPWVGEIASDLYTQATGRRVDGVISMDPFVVAKLLGYSGPVHLASLDQDVTPDNAVSFLLRDQYVVGAADNDIRADGLAEAAELVFDRLIAGALPEPIELARDLGPYTSQRRLLVWSADADEQALLEQVHIAGAIPALDGADGWSFTVSNTGGSKIDSFLERQAGYAATTDPATGATTATMRVELTNTAPADGFPAYVIGNQVGKPPGTSSLLVSLYSPLGLEGVTLDGSPVGVAAGTEDGWRTYRFFVDIPPGGTVAIEARLAGTVAHPDDDAVTWTQPMSSDVQPLD